MPLYRIDVYWTNDDDIEHFAERLWIVGNDEEDARKKANQVADTPGDAPRSFRVTAFPGEDSESALRRESVASFLESVLRRVFGGVQGNEWLLDFTSADDSEEWLVELMYSHDILGIGNELA